MAITYKALIDSKTMEAASTIQYSAPSDGRAAIDKFTATNTSVSAATISIWLVPLGSSADNSTLIIDALSIEPGETISLYDISGQIINVSGSLYTAGTGSALTIRASGREIT